MSEPYFRPLRALILGAVLALPALAVAAPIEPAQIVREQATNLQLSPEVSRHAPRLIPGGPFVRQELTLPGGARALASDGRRHYVASGDGRLLQLRFADDGTPARIVAQQPMTEAIAALELAGDYLLVRLDDGIALLAVDEADQIRPLWRFRTGHRTLAAHLGDGHAWLLLDDRRLLRLPLGELAPAEADAHWTLPNAARDFALHDGSLFSVGDSGLSSLQLSAGQAHLLDRLPLSGEPARLRLTAGLALVAAGSGGLQVVDVERPAQLRWLGSHAKRGAVYGLSVEHEHAWVGIDGQSVLALSLGNPALPAARAALRLKAPLVALSAHHDRLLAATTAGVQYLDFATPPAADISPEGLNLGGSRRGVIRDDLLYVADWFSGLHIYDIRNPANPRHLGNYHTPGSSKGVALYGDYALVGDDDRGLQIIDVADPRRPRWVAELGGTSEVSTVGLAYTMKRVGSTLYLADHRGGFQIIDLTDIRQPRILGALDTPGKSWAIDVVDDTAFVADDDDGLLVFAVDDPRHIRLLGQFDPGGHAEDVVLRDGLAYVAFFDNGLFIVDVSDPSQPRPLSHLAIPGNARGIQLAGDLAYVSGWESGLQVVDIHDPAAPRIVGSYDTDGAAWGVNLAAGHAFVLDWWGGIKVLDVTQPARPAFVGRYQGADEVRGLRTDGRFAFAASGARGLQIYDTRNPLNPIWAGGIDLAGEARDLWLEDGHAYVAAGDGGVAVIDVLDPFQARRVGGLATPGVARQVRARDDYLYIADARAGLLVADVREPTRPRLIARHALSVNDLWLDDRGLYVAGPEGLRWYRSDVDGTLTLQARLAGTAAQWVRSDGAGLLALAGADGDIQLLQQRDDGLQVVGHYAAGEGLRDLQFDQGQLYLLRTDGLLCLDIADPSQPRPSVHYPASAHHEHLALSHGAALFGGQRRLNSLRLLPPVRVVAGDDGLTFRLPNGLPMGRYHLALDDGRVVAEALRVSRHAPGKKIIDLKAMRRLLKPSDQPPAAP